MGVGLGLGLGEGEGDGEEVIVGVREGSGEGTGVSLAVGGWVMATSVAEGATGGSEMLDKEARQASAAVNSTSQTTSTGIRKRLGLCGFLGSGELKDGIGSWIECKFHGGKYVQPVSPDSHRL